jgi:hypothetical protein
MISSDRRTDYARSAVEPVSAEGDWYPPGAEAGQGLIAEPSSLTLTESPAIGTRVRLLGRVEDTTHDPGCSEAATLAGPHRGADGPGLCGILPLPFEPLGHAAHDR